MSKLKVIGATPWRMPAAILLTVAFALDVRFRLSETASFTVFEVLAWTLGPLVVFAWGLPKGTIASAARSHWGLLAWVGWATFAGFLSIVGRQHSATLPLLKNTLPAAWLFLVVVAAVRTRDDLHKLLLAFFLAMSGNALLGLVQSLTGQGYFVQSAVEVFYKIDFAGGFAKQAAMGTFGHPNNFGLFIAPAVAMAAALCIGAPRSALKTLAPLFLLVGLPALYFTFMKSGLAWAAVGVAVGLAPRIFRRPGLIVAAIGLVSWLVVAEGLARSHANRLFASLETRVELWDNARAMISQNLASTVFGADPIQTAYRAKTSMGWLFPHAHNGYINQALFFGVPAGVFFIVALYQLFSSAGRPSPAFLGEHVDRGVTAAAVTFAGILVLENLSTPNMLALVGFLSALAYCVSAPVLASATKPAAVSLQPARSVR